MATASELVTAACADHKAAALLPQSIREGLAARHFPPEAVIAALLTPFGNAPSPPPSMWTYCRHACDILAELLSAGSVDQYQMALRVSLFLIHLRPEAAAVEAASRAVVKGVEDIRAHGADARGRSRAQVTRAHVRAR